MDYPWLFRLDGRHAAVVGAGSGIGRAAAHALAAHGAAVTCLDVDGNTAAAAATAHETGTTARAQALDVCAPEEG